VKRLRSFAVLAIIGLAIGTGFGWLMVQMWNLSTSLFWVLAGVGLIAEAAYLLNRRRRAG
jgi:glucose dehydrogenase